MYSRVFRHLILRRKNSTPMPRAARIVIPGIPHHIIQRGNRRQRVFFDDENRRFYLGLLAKYGKKYGIDYLAYCLMGNHVHLVAVPSHEISLAKGIGDAHKAYTRVINERQEWTGYLWQGRFISFPMEESYLYPAFRYVEMNPVRAKLVQRPEEYRWSSARFHIFSEKDTLVSNSSFADMIGDWAKFLSEVEKGSGSEIFREHISSGLPLGGDAFIKKLEAMTGLILKKRKRGPKE